MNQPMKMLGTGLLLISLGVFSAHAAEKVAAGPNGGRILKNDAVSAEFFVQTDRKIRITLLDESLKPVAPSGQSIEAVIGKGKSKQTISFNAADQWLESIDTLPKGHELLIVVRITPKPGEQTHNFRIPFHEGV